MIVANEQRSNHAVSYSLDGDTLTVSVDGETIAYTFPTDDGYMTDPPFPIIKAERRDGTLNVEVIRTLDARGNPIEGNAGEPVDGAVSWQPWFTEAELKKRLKQRLQQVAANKRSIAMLEDRQERIIAHVLRITAIEIKVFQGILQQIGRDPVAQGDITQSEFDYMAEIKNRAAKVDAAFAVEEAIEADIESGVISDPDYDIESDPRWQYGG